MKKIALAILLVMLAAAGSAYACGQTIHELQVNSAAYIGQLVTPCDAVVTAVRYNGFFCQQAPHGAYDGIDDLAAYMRTQAPPGSVLYHYWLGHHYHFYLYGAPLRLHCIPTWKTLPATPMSTAGNHATSPSPVGGMVPRLSPPWRTQA